MIERKLSAKLQSLAQKFQVITLTGPRQSGKTTLAKAVFPEIPYVSMEAPDIRRLAQVDPRGFLANYPTGVVLDEIQNTPELFSYIQGIVDDDPKSRFILTGSSNFLLLEKISQTLAGRTAILHLLPLSLEELRVEGKQYEEFIFNGLYPAVHARSIDPNDYYPSYIQTYVERDVRMMKNIGDVNTFIQFVRLCAGRIGQPLNLTGLAVDAGISLNTAKSWLSILETSYILFRVQPYYRNFSKRQIKSPKLYFHDTGVARSLLGIRSADQVATHYLRGSLFENLIITEFIKRKFNQGETQPSYFWQDSHGKEVDWIMEEGEKMTPVEIKSGRTITTEYFDNIKSWNELTGSPQDAGYVVYGGDLSLQTADGRLVCWRNLSDVYQV